MGPKMRSSNKRIRANSESTPTQNNPEKPTEHLKKGTDHADPLLRDGNFETHPTGSHGLLEPHESKRSHHLPTL